MKLIHISWVWHHKSAFLVAETETPHCHPQQSEESPNLSGISSQAKLGFMASMQKRILGQASRKQN